MRRFLAFPLLLLGCGLLSFTVEQDARTTVPGAGIVGSLLGALDFTGLDDIDIEVQRKMADQGVDDGDLRSVTLTTLTLHAEPDLSFLESIDVTVEADGESPVLVATGDSFPEGQDTVALTMTGADLTALVTAGAMAFTVDASGSAPVDDTDIDVHVEIEVEATVQGACAAASRDSAGD